MRSNVLSLAFVVLLLPGLATAEGTGFNYEEVLTEGLDKPMDLIFVSNAGAVIVGLTGQIYHMDTEGKRSELGSISSHVQSGKPEEGLLGVAVSPNFDAAGHLYVYFTVKGGPIAQRVARIPLTRDGHQLQLDVGKIETVIDELPYSKVETRNSGAIAISPDDHLFVGVGDNGGIQTKWAQDLTRYNGKVLRLTLDGKAAPGNPTFAGAPSGAKKEIFALGFGRPFRIGVDAIDGTVFVGDVALQKYEEVNKVAGGENFGWPQLEGANGPGPGGADATDPTSPYYEYDHNLNPNNGFVVIGAPYRAGKDAPLRFPDNFQGAVPVADFYQTWVRFLIPKKGGAGDYDVFEQTPGPAQVRAIATGTDGAVYFVEAGKQIVSRITWADSPPDVTIETPVEGLRYSGGDTVTLKASANDAEEGPITAGFSWQLTLFDGQDKVVDQANPTGGEASYTLPAAIDIHGRLEIVVRVKDSVGSEGKAERTLDPVATKITYTSDPVGVELTIDGVSVTEETTLSYVAGTAFEVSCPIEFQDATGELLVFQSWSDGGDATHTYTVPDSDAEMVCTYGLHSVPSVKDAGVNVITDARAYYAEGPEEEPSADSEGCQSGPRGGSGAPPLMLLTLVLLALVFRRISWSRGRSARR